MHFVGLPLGHNARYKQHKICKCLQIPVVTVGSRSLHRAAQSVIERITVRAFRAVYHL